MVRLNTVVCVPIFACRYSQMNSNKTVEVLKMETIHDGPPSTKMTVSGPDGGGGEGTQPIKVLKAHLIVLSRK